MTYPGGKNGAGVYQSIINQMPPHDLYIEPFAGSAAVYRAKRPARISILIEIEDEAYRAIKPIENTAANEYYVLSTDGVAWLAARKTWTGRELVYGDPPYPRSSRRSDRAIYKHEWSDADHVAFLIVAQCLPCMVMISGYDHPIYHDMLADWRLVKFTGQTRRGPAIEHLWCNFPEPKVLHDPQYLGKNRTDRQRIKRKAERWKSRLAALTPLERQAVLSVALLDSDRA